MLFIGLLGAEGYWRSLEEKAAAAEDEQGENGSNQDKEQPAAKKLRTLNPFGDDSRFPVERAVGEDMPMEVKQVVAEGSWIFEAPRRYRARRTRWQQ